MGAISYWTGVLVGGAAINEAQNEPWDIEPACYCFVARSKG